MNVVIIVDSTDKKTRTQLVQVYSWICIVQPLVLQSIRPTRVNHVRWPTNWSLSALQGVIKMHYNLRERDYDGIALTFERRRSWYHFLKLWLELPPCQLSWTAYSHISVWESCILMTSITRPIAPRRVSFFVVYIRYIQHCHYPLGADAITTLESGARCVRTVQN